MLSHSMARDALIYTGVNGSGGAGSEGVCVRGVGVGRGSQPRPGIYDSSTHYQSFVA